MSENNSKISSGIKSIQKREIHTSCIQQANGKDITISPKSLQNKMDENISIKYLMFVKAVLSNKEYSDIECQRILEEKWFDLITERLDDTEYLIQHYSPNLVNKLKEAKKTLSIMGDAVKKIFLHYHLF